MKIIVYDELQLSLRPKSFIKDLDPKNLEIKKSSIYF